MQILERLVRLSRSDMLPIPFAHRIPLGLLNGTAVQVGLTKGVDRLGDIVVSVLNLEQYVAGTIFRVTVRHKDQAGLIGRAVGALKNLNIALAEAVTTEEHNIHEITFICELIEKTPNPYPQPVSQQEIEERLKAAGFSLDPGVNMNRDHAKVEVLRKLVGWDTTINPDVSVNQGWLVGVDYLSALRRQPNYDDLLPDYDLDFASERGVLVVVSADTERRLMRYKFPRRHARTLKVRHRDRPGALDIIFKELEKRRLNVLSSYLRRGGETRGWAKLIAICEPAPSLTNESDVARTFEEAVESIRKQNRGKYHFTPRLSVAEPDYHLVHMSEARAFHLPILISREFLGTGAGADHLVERLDSILRSVGCIPIESPRTSATLGVRGGILPIGPGRAERALLRLKVAHRLGQLGALGRPILVIAAESFLERLSGVVDTRSIKQLSVPAGVLTGGMWPVELEDDLKRWLVDVRAKPARPTR